MKQIKRSVILLALAFTLVLVPAGIAQAKKPLRLECAGSGAPYGWIGEIIGGDLDGATIIWVSLIVEPNRGPLTLEDAANVYFYEEWFIGDGIAFVGNVSEVWSIEPWGNVVLAGVDEGVTRFKNGKFTGNGRVTEATGIWADLVGRKEHLSGMVTDWGIPGEVPPDFVGTLQIN